MTEIKLIPCLLCGSEARHLDWPVSKTMPDGARMWLCSKNEMIGAGSCKGGLFPTPESWNETNHERHLPKNQRAESFLAIQEILNHSSAKLSETGHLGPRETEMYHRAWSAFSFLMGETKRLEDKESFSLPPFQARVAEWTLSTFGYDLTNNVSERRARFFEEAIELAQATDMSREEAHFWIDQVYKKPKGVIHQEISGVLMSLSALANAGKVDIMTNALMELNRVDTNKDAIREKQKAKPKYVEGSYFVATHNSPPCPHESLFDLTTGCDTPVVFCPVCGKNIMCDGKDISNDIDLLISLMSESHKRELVNNPGSEISGYNRTTGTIFNLSDRQKEALRQRLRGAYSDEA